MRIKKKRCSPKRLIFNKKEKICTGCGSSLQTTDELKPGYISVKKNWQNSDSSLEKSLSFKSKNDFLFLFPEELKQVEEINAKLVTNPDLAKEFEVESGILKAETKKNRAILCKRCWYLKNYNQVLPVSIKYEDLSKKLEIIKEKSKHRTSVLKIVDIFDFDASLIPDFRSLVGDKTMLYLVANKLDLLPKRVSFRRVRQWLQL